MLVLLHLPETHQTCRLEWWSPCKFMYRNAHRLPSSMQHSYISRLQTKQELGCHTCWYWIEHWAICLLIFSRPASTCAAAIEWNWGKQQVGSMCCTAKTGFESVKTDPC
jgi:hypothetical protein